MVCIPTKEVNGVLLDLQGEEPTGHSGENCGKWLCTRDITVPQCKGMLKTLQRSVKNANGGETKYTPAIRVFIQLWLHIYSIAGGWIL